MTESCVVHVEQPAEVVTPLAGVVPDAKNALAQRVEVVSNLCAILEERVPSYVRSRPILKNGDAATEIVRAAHEEGADLIVLTTHGACGFRPGVLGAVAEAVVRTAHCPVLTISAPACGATLPPTDNQQSAAPINLPRPEIAMAPAHKIYVDGD